MINVLSRSVCKRSILAREEGLYNYVIKLTVPMVKQVWRYQSTHILSRGCSQSAQLTEYRKRDRTAVSGTELLEEAFDCVTVMAVKYL